MKLFLARLGAVLCKTWVWSLLLLVGLSVLVWFAGPTFAVNDQRFWQSAVSRLATLAVMSLCWGLFMVFAGWRVGVKKRRDEGDAKVIERTARTAGMALEERTLRERFKEAVHTVRHATLYEGKSARRRNDLPWYVLIGPEGSGKTSLLEYSGLDFPLNNKVPLRLNRETLGTEFPEWYFADHAVLIDTCGRYLTQPNPEVDAHGWKTLLGLLKKRRRRPLNGVLVTLTGAHLCSEQLPALAEQTRLRLADIHAVLGVQVPVYLVVSKVDTLAGFASFFEDISRQENDQVLGVSFTKGQDGTDAIVVGDAFESLLSRLNSQALHRMHPHRNGQRNGSLRAFPERLSQLGAAAALFIDTAFVANNYQHGSQLRGVYLTSAPQVELQKHKGPRLSRGMLPTLRSGSARFIKQLLTQVIFPEAQLATLDKREVRRIRLRQRAMYAASAVCLTAFSALWFKGYNANLAHLAQQQTLAKQITEKLPALNPAADALPTLAILDHSLAATRVFPTLEGTSMLTRNGLYQGTEMNPVAQLAYHQQLENLLLPRVANQLEAQVRNSLGNREALLSSLRTYLMLNLAERRDNSVLAQALAADWSARYLTNSAAQSALNEHFNRLLAEGFAPYPLNTALVAQARDVLRKESMAQVVYRMLQEQARSMPAYSFDQALGTAGAVFAGGNTLIPGLYTQRGYTQAFKGQGSGLLHAILQDNWVMGDQESLSPHDLTRLLGELEKAYFNDYTRHWGEAITQLSLTPISTPQQGAAQLMDLTTASSPLLKLLVEIRDNTRLGALPTVAVNEALPEALAGAAQLASQAQAVLANALPNDARTAMERRFEHFHQLLNDQEGPALALDNTLRGMDALQAQLNGLAQGNPPEQAAYEMAKLRISSGQRDAINQVRDSAARLPHPVGPWLTQLANNSWKAVLSDANRYVNQQYQTELYPAYSASIKARFPFDAHTSSEVSLADFRSFFRTDGTADRFFATYLKPFVSGAPGHYQPRHLEGQGLPLNPELLRQMGQAKTIQQAFFAENAAEPLLLFKLEPHTLDASLSRAEFRTGNQRLDYRHGPILQTAFRWPAKADDGRTSLVVEDAKGQRTTLENTMGEWSLFRWLDLMDIEQQRGRDVLLVKANVGGKRVNYLLHSQRTPNPFDIALLRDFKLPATL